MRRNPPSEKRVVALPKEVPQPIGDRRRASRQEEPPIRTNGGPPALTPLHFSTRELAPQDQFAAWAAYLAPILVARLPDSTSLNTGFQAEHVAWNLGHMLIVRQRAAAYSFERSEETIRTSPIDHWCVVVPISGTMWASLDGRVAKSQVNSVFIRSLGSPFRGRTTEGEYIFLHMSRDLFSSVPFLPEASDHVVVSGSLAEMLVEYLQAVEARLATFTQVELPGVVQTIREMVISCMMPSVGRADVPKKQSSLALMERARQYIQDNLGSTQLNPLSLSRALGTSRTQLYGLFEGNGGVARYIQRRRLLAGHAALCDPDQRGPISDIAEGVGFHSAADFSRAFKREFDYSPSEARSRVGMPDRANAPQPLKTHEQDTFKDWLKALGV